jgi:hypothetical protein
MHGARKETHHLHEKNRTGEVPTEDGEKIAGGLVKADLPKLVHIGPFAGGAKESVLEAVRRLLKRFVLEVVQFQWRVCLEGKWR